MSSSDTPYLRYSRCSALSAAALFLLLSAHSVAGARFRTAPAPTLCNSSESFAGLTPSPAAAPRASPEPDMLPVHLSLSLIVLAGRESAELDVSVSAVPPGGGSVQLLCDAPDAVSSPSGNWPYEVAYPEGSSETESIAIRASNVILPTIVTVYAGDSDADPDDPSQWSAVGTVIVLPSL